MKKQMYGIIGLSAAVAVLGGGLAVLKLTDRSDEDGGSTSEVEATTEYGAGIVIVGDTPGMPEPATEGDGTEAHSIVESVRVTNESGVLDVYLQTPPNENGYGAVYSFKGYEDIPLENSMIGTLVYNVDGMVSASIIEDSCDDPDKFGLGDTAITVELTYGSGNVKKLYIGDNAPVSYRTYVMAEGSNTVYTVANSLTANYRKELKEFVNKTILEEPSEADYPRVDSLRVEREDIDYDIFLEYDPSTEDSNSGGTSSVHVMKEPVEAYLTADKALDITNGMFGLKGNDFYSIHCRESDIASAGLKDPYCRVTMSCNDGNEYVLLLSEQFKDESGASCCYGMLEGGNIIYIISADKAKWLSLMPIDIASRLMITSYVWNLGSLNVKTSDGRSESFTIELKDGGTDRTGVSAGDVIVKRNGSECPTDRYRQFYSFVLQAHAEEFALDEPVPNGEPIVSIEYTDEYRGTAHKLEFYEYSSMKVLITVDGESRFFGSRSYVNTLLDNIDRISSGEEYVTTWQS